MFDPTPARHLSSPSAAVLKMPLLPLPTTAYGPLLTKALQCGCDRVLACGGDTRDISAFAASNQPSTADCTHSSVKAGLEGTAPRLTGTTSQGLWYPGSHSGTSCP